MREYKQNMTKEQKEQILESHDLISEITGRGNPDIIKIDGYKAWFYGDVNGSHKWDWLYLSTILEKLGYR